MPPAPAAVLDDEGLPERLGELRRDDAPERVRGAARGERRDDAHRFHRPARLGKRGRHEGARRTPDERFQEAASRNITTRRTPWRTPPKRRYRTTSASSSRRSRAAASSRTLRKRTGTASSAPSPKCCTGRRSRRRRCCSSTTSPITRRATAARTACSARPYRLSLVLGMEPSMSDNRKEMLDHFRKHIKKGFKPRAAEDRQGRPGARERHARREGRHAQVPGADPPRRRRRALHRHRVRRRDEGPRHRAHQRGHVSRAGEKRRTPAPRTSRTASRAASIATST